jgi:hypothetical protein
MNPTGLNMVSGIPSRRLLRMAAISLFGRLRGQAAQAVHIGILTNISRNHVLIGGGLIPIILFIGAEIIP